MSGPLPRTIRIGCSGWQYAHRCGDFYPAELPTSRWFAHYALTFDTVEINNSFYRYDERTYELLRRYDVALCLHDTHGSAAGKLVVGPFIYLRFHFGTKKYGGRYPDDRLDAWSEWLAARSAEGLHVFAYFNNDTGGHAQRDAARLRQKIAGTIASRANARAPRTYASDR